MLNLFINLLPKEHQSLYYLARRIFANLDTPEERAEVLAYAEEVLLDGTITLPEWGKLGGKLGIIKGNGRKRN